MATEIWGNNKWIFPQQLKTKGKPPLQPAAGSYKKSTHDSRPDLINDPEYIIDFKHVYHFAYSNHDNEVEREMAGGRAANGDVDANGKVYQYYGAAELRGVGANGSWSANRGYPANNPFLQPTLTLYAPISDAVNDAERCIPQYWPTPGLGGTPGDQQHKQAIEKLVRKFTNVTVKWDFALVGGSNGSLMLEPGYAYVLKAKFELSAVLSINKWTLYKSLEGFSTKLASTSVEKVSLDYFSRHKAIVHYIIEFEPEAHNQIKKQNYMIDSLVADLAAVTAVLGLAHYMVFLWQWLTGSSKRYEAVMRSKLTTK